MLRYTSLNTIKSHKEPGQKIAQFLLAQVLRAQVLPGQI